MIILVAIWKCIQTWFLVLEGKRAAVYLSTAVYILVCTYFWPNLVVLYFYNQTTYEFFSNLFILKSIFSIINIAFFMVGATSDAENLFRSWPLPCCSTNWWQRESDVCPFKVDTSKTKQISYLFCIELHFCSFLTLYQALQNSSKLF